MKLTINSVLQVVIEKYNQKGEGVAFYQQMPIYVFGTIIQEVVVIQITYLKKTYAVGQVLEILKPSANRVEHQIANAHLIGGYELIHMNDQEQIRFKKERFINDFWQIAKTKITDLAIF